MRRGAVALAPLLAVVLAPLLPAAGHAQEFPRLYAVTGVAAGDRLNIRDDPSAGVGRIIASYPPGATGIEVIATAAGGRWGLVGLPGRSGYVAMRFLRAQTDRPSQTLRRFTCAGTEPFWALKVTPDGAIWSDPERGDVPARLRRSTRMLDSHGRQVLAAEFAGSTYHATIEAAQCSDGMSDRIYGWTISGVYQAPQGQDFLYGCCTADASGP